MENNPESDPRAAMLQRASLDMSPEYYETFEDLPEDLRRELELGGLDLSPMTLEEAERIAQNDARIHQEKVDYYEKMIEEAPQILSELEIVKGAARKVGISSRSYLGYMTTPNIEEGEDELTPLEWLAKGGELQPVITLIQHAFIV